MNRTTKAQPAACVPIKTKEAADAGESTGPQYNEATADCRWGSQRKARATSAIEYQIRGHGCGVVVLKAIEEHITAEQDDCQQAISKIGRLSEPVIAHFAGSLSWRTDRSALCGRPC